MVMNIPCVEWRIERIELLPVAKDV